MLVLALVPVVSVAAHVFGRYLRELSHKTQAAAAVACSMAEVVDDILIPDFCFILFINSESWKSYTFHNPFILYNVYHNKHLVFFFMEEFCINIMDLKFIPASLKAIKRRQQNLD